MPEVMRRPKVILGMSGGVDSSVSAYLLKEQGFDVEGVSFILWEAQDAFSGCCSLSSAQGAKRTADRLGICHNAVDVRGEFSRQVIEPFAEAYAKGLTPNPCIQCNRHIKFPFLLREAEQRRAEYIATGHYARVCDDSSAGGGTVLKKGLDEKKDQSYVLCMLREEELRRLVLPLGTYKKQGIRDIARSLGLEAAYWPESQEICFIEDNNYCAFLEKRDPLLNTPGPIIDNSGKQIGLHRGIYRYTVGQRKGLGLASLNPWYVTRIDTEHNTVCVGAKEDAVSKVIRVSQINWLCRPDSIVFHSNVKVRSMMKGLPALIETNGDTAAIVFDEPVWAAAPGQSAVFYDGDTVLGGGVIMSG